MAARIALAASAGVALGAVGRWSDHLSDAPQLLFALGSPWVVVAFAVGALERSLRRGAGLAALSMFVSVAAYYAIMFAVERRCGAPYAAAMTVLWGGAGVAVGVLFGAAGAAARSAARRPAALALVGGALAGEALLFLARGEDPRVLVAQLAVGAAAPLAAGGGRRTVRAGVLAGAVAFVAFVADAAIRVVARRYGWGGA